MSDTMTPCTVEDGSLPGQSFPCLWNASEFGNGTGHSFVLDAVDAVPQYVFEIDAEGTVYTQPTPPEFVTLCHDGQTFTVEQWVSVDHLARHGQDTDDRAGDHLGECVTPESADVQEQQAMDLIASMTPSEMTPFTASEPVEATIVATTPALAETGMDPSGVLLAGVLVVVGMAAVLTRRFAR